MDLPLLTSLTTRSEDETDRLARALSAGLAPGDTLLLSGPIGAGKTRFARALIQARLAAEGRMEDVPSPTFTLVQTYGDGQAEIWHADLYRLGHADELVELGLDAAFEDAICLVEWPDRLGELAPEGALWIEFIPVGETARELRFLSDAPGWAARLEAALAHG